MLQTGSYSLQLGFRQDHGIEKGLHVQFVHVKLNKNQIYKSLVLYLMYMSK